MYECARLQNVRVGEICVKTTSETVTVLTNAPNSCPPERLFSMFNATFGEDQKSSFGDYLELAMQSQYNKRNV